MHDGTETIMSLWKIQGLSFKAKAKDSTIKDKDKAIPLKDKAKDSKIVLKDTSRPRTNNTGERR